MKKDQLLSSQPILPQSLLSRKVSSLPAAVSLDGGRGKMCFLVSPLLSVIHCTRLAKQGLWKFFHLRRRRRRNKCDGRASERETIGAFFKACQFSRPCVSPRANKRVVLVGWVHVISIWRWDSLKYFRSKSGSSNYTGRWIYRIKILRKTVFIFPIYVWKYGLKASISACVPATLAKHLSCGHNTTLEHTNIQTRPNVCAKAGLLAIGPVGW